MPLVVPNPIAYGSPVVSSPLEANLAAITNAINIWIPDSDQSVFTVFNPLFYLLSSTSGAGVNLAAMTAMLAAAAGAGGGTCPIPQGQYTINPGLNVGDSIDVIGNGTGGQFVVNENGNLFSATGITDGIGITIKNLRIKYASGITGYPIYVNGASQVRGENLWFSDCSAMQKNNGDACGLYQCTLENDNVNNLVWVTMTNGSQTYVRNCVFRQQPGGPTGNVAVTIYDEQTVYIEGNHFSDMDYGIQFFHGGVDTFVTNCVFSSNIQSVSFIPDSAGQRVGAYFTANTFAGTNDATGTSPGALVDTNTQLNSQLDNVQWNNNTFINAMGSGLKINAGHVIQVTGGRYSANGVAVGTYAGIEITGGDIVSVYGANCTGVYEKIGNIVQAYGMIVNLGSNTTAVTIDHCDLTLNTAGALHVIGTPTTLKVTKCRGYNDQKTAIVSGTTNLPLSSSSASAHGYYGPSQITFYGATNYTLNGQEYTITSGQIWLDSPYDTIVFTGSPTGTWIGR